MRNQALVVTVFVSYRLFLSNHIAFSCLHFAAGGMTAGMAVSVQRSVT